VRHGKTIGAPVALRIENRTGQLERILPVEPSGTIPAQKNSSRPPRHADLAVTQNSLSRRALHSRTRSARETASRVAAGAFAKLFLRELGTEIASHTFKWTCEARPRQRGKKFARSATTWTPAALRDSATEQK